MSLFPEGLVSPVVSRRMKKAVLALAGRWAIARSAAMAGGAVAASDLARWLYYDHGAPADRMLWVLAHFAAAHPTIAPPGGPLGLPLHRRIMECETELLPTIRSGNGLPRSGPEALFAEWQRAAATQAELELGRANVDMPRLELEAYAMMQGTTSLAAVGAFVRKRTGMAIPHALDFILRLQERDGASPVPTDVSAAAASAAPWRERTRAGVPRGPCEVFAICCDGFVSVASGFGSVDAMPEAVIRRPGEDYGLQYLLPEGEI